MAFKAKSLKWGGLGILALGAGILAKKLHSRKRSPAEGMSILADKLQTVKMARAQLEEVMKKLDQESERLQAEMNALKCNDGPEQGPSDEA